MSQRQRIHELESHLEELESRIGRDSLLRGAVERLEERFSEADERMLALETREGPSQPVVNANRLMDSNLRTRRYAVRGVDRALEHSRSAFELIGELRLRSEADFDDLFLRVQALEQYIRAEHELTHETFMNTPPLTNSLRRFRSSAIAKIRGWNL